MEIRQRTSKFTTLNKYDPFCKEHAFVEVCEWSNGEGFDVTIGDKMFQFTWGEFEAMTALVHYKG